MVLSSEKQLSVQGSFSCNCALAADRWGRREGRRTTVPCSLTTASSHLHPGEAEALMTPFSFNLDPQAAAPPPNNSQALPAPGTCRKAHLPTRNRKGFLWSPRSAHQKSRPRAPMRVGTVAGRAGWNPLHGWEPPFPDGCAWGWEGEGRAGRGLPASSAKTESKSGRNSWEGSFVSERPPRSSNKGRKYSHYSQKG